MDKGSTVIDAGVVDFAMSYRKEIMNDQGLCLQVYSKIGDKDTEILRFDCFDQAPHYHYGPENHNIRLHNDKSSSGMVVLRYPLQQPASKWPPVWNQQHRATLQSSSPANVASFQLLSGLTKGRVLPRLGTCLII